MKVHNQNLKEILLRNQTEKSDKNNNLKPVKEHKNMSSLSVGKGNVVKISQEAELLEKANRIMQQHDDFNAEKVAHIKNLLQSGSYQIDNEKLAGKFADMLNGGGEE